MDIIDYIKTIRETQGTNDKLDLLRDYMKDETFRRILFYTYNPFYNYYIRKIPDVTIGSGSAETSFEDMFGLLDNLRNRKFTGNLAIGEVANFIKTSPAKLAEVFILILGRDLKMGINTTSINKVYPNSQIRSF